MTAFGISLFTPSGQKFFSTESTTWSYVGSFIAPANAAVSRTFDALSLIGETIIQRSFIDAPPGNQEAIIHSCTRIGNTITASGGNVCTLVVVMAR